MPTESHTVINLATGYNRLGDLRKANARAGLFFFSPDTMAFFDSKVESDLYAGALFITSERPPASLRVGEWKRRRFTLRAALHGGGVCTVGAFGAYPTRAKAHKAAMRYAAELRDDGQAIRDGLCLTFASPV